MKVYVLKENLPYEGFIICGIYSRKKQLVDEYRRRCQTSMARFPDNPEGMSVSDIFKGLIANDHKHEELNYSVAVFELDPSKKERRDRMYMTAKYDGARRRLSSDLYNTYVMEGLDADDVELLWNAVDKYTATKKKKTRLQGLRRTLACMMGLAGRSC